jgi:hypothetical protein
VPGLVRLDRVLLALVLGLALSPVLELLLDYVHPLMVLELVRLSTIPELAPLDCTHPSMVLEPAPWAASQPAVKEED